MLIVGCESDYGTAKQWTGVVRVYKMTERLAMSKLKWPFWIFKHSERLLGIFKYWAYSWNIPLVQLKPRYGHYIKKQNLRMKVVCEQKSPGQR